MRGKCHGHKKVFNVTRWLRETRQRQALSLMEPTAMRAHAPGSVTAMAAKQHDPETARLIAEWDAKARGSP